MFPGHSLEAMADDDFGFSGQKLSEKGGSSCCNRSNMGVSKLCVYEHEWNVCVCK